MFNEMASVQVTDYSDHTPLDPSAAAMLKLYGGRLGLGNTDLAEIAGVKEIIVEGWWEGGTLPPEGFLAILHFGSRLASHNAELFVKQCFAGRVTFPVFKDNETARIFERREQAEGVHMWPQLGHAVGMFAAISNLSIQLAHETVETLIDEQQSAIEPHHVSDLDTPVFETAFFGDLPYEAFRWGIRPPSPTLRLVK